MYEVAVADMGNGEYMLVEPNRTQAGLARVLAVAVQMHIASDEEKGRGERRVWPEKRRLRLS
jgi:hypothetical protein